MRDIRPFYFMMVGLPGSGKSYLRYQIVDNFEPRSVAQASSDDYLDLSAKVNGGTYNDAFKQFANTAVQVMHDVITDALAAGKTIIHDQTNLRPRKRVGVLSRVPAHYLKVAVVVEIDEELRQKRLHERHGKTIPVEVDKNMHMTYETPTLAEGFDMIVTPAVALCFRRTRWVF